MLRKVVVVVLIFCNVSLIAQNNQLHPKIIKAFKVFEDGNSTKALKLMTKYVNKYPNDYNGYCVRGDFYLSSNYSQAALNDYKIASKFSDRDAFIESKISSAYMATQDFDRAQSRIKKAIKYDPENGRYHLQNAMILSVMGDFSSSIKFIESGLELVDDPDDDLTFHMDRLRAENYYNLGQYESSEKYYRLCLSDDDQKNIDIWNKIGIINKIHRNYEVATDYFNKCIAADNSNPYRFLQLAKVQLLQEDVDNAMVSIDKSINITPNWPTLYLFKGSVYQEKEEYDNALKMYDKVDKIDSHIINNYIGRVNCFVKMGDTIAAIEIIENMENHYKDSINGTYWAAEAWRIVGDNDKVLSTARDVLRLDSRNGLSAFLISSVHLENENYVKCREWLYKSLEWDESNSVAGNNNIGLCYWYEGEYDKAMEYYQLSIDENPEFTYSYNNMGNSYLEKGDTVKACEYWNLALEKGYFYQVEWLEEYKIIDPAILIEQNCKQD